MFRIAAIAVVLSSLLAFAEPAITQVKDVHFLATGPAGLKIIGQTAKLELRNDGERVVLSVPLDTVDTGISLRNTHMKEKYLDTRAYPNAELSVPLAALKEGKGQVVKGQFTVHGKTKEVAVLVDVARSGAAFEVNGAFDINLKDFDIIIPSYLGVTVKPEVQVIAAFSLQS